MYNVTFPGQVITLTLGQILTNPLRSNYSLLHSSRQENDDDASTRVRPPPSEGGVPLMVPELCVSLSKNAELGQI